MTDEQPAIKKPSERDNLDLLELVSQLSARFSHNPTKEMHEAYWEARRELERRLSPKFPTDPL